MYQQGSKNKNSNSPGITKAKRQPRRAPYHKTKPLRTNASRENVTNYYRYTFIFASRNCNNGSPQPVQ